MKLNQKSISFCGLCCNECPFFVGRIADLAKQLIEEQEKVSFARVAKGLSELIDEYTGLSRYNIYEENLKIIESIRCKKLCRDGGGTESCQIRNCCQSRNFQGCWECNQFKSCEILAYLKPVNADSNIKNINTIKDKGLAEFLHGKRYW